MGGALQVSLSYPLASGLVDGWVRGWVWGLCSPGGSLHPLQDALISAASSAISNDAHCQVCTAPRKAELNYIASCGSVPNVKIDSLIL